MAAFGPFGKLVVALNENKSTRDEFRACATSLFDKQNPPLTAAQKDVLLRRDPGAIRAAFIAENGGDDGTPGHVRAAAFVNQLNNPADQ